MFQELIIADHGLELFGLNEEILLPVMFAPAGRARRVGDGEVQVGNDLAELVDQGRLARSRRRRNDEYDAHSTFCTCSRAFSISDLMAKPISVILRASPASPDVLDIRVLASRFISWSRKSNFLPTSPGWSSMPRKCCTCVSSRTSSSWMSLRSTSSAASCMMRSLSACAPINSCILVLSFST